MMPELSTLFDVKKWVWKTGEMALAQESEALAEKKSPTALFVDLSQISGLNSLYDGTVFCFRFQLQNC
jgi:hypothetical protein